MKPCKNCGWIGANIGCDTCGPPLRERKVNRPSGETTCSGSSILNPPEYSALWYADRIVALEAELKEMALQCQQMKDALHAAHKDRLTDASARRERDSLKL